MSANLPGEEQRPKGDATKQQRLSWQGGHISDLPSKEMTVVDGRVEAVLLSMLDKTVEAARLEDKHSRPTAVFLLPFHKLCGNRKAKQMFSNSVCTTNLRSRPSLN